MYYIKCSNKEMWDWEISQWEILNPLHFFLLDVDDFIWKDNNRWRHMDAVSLLFINLDRE